MSMNFGGGGRGGGGGRNQWQLRELAKNEKFEWSIIRRALSGLAPYWPHAVVTMVILLITSALSVVPASLTQHIIDDGISKGKLGTIIWLTAALIAMPLVSGL